MVIVACDDSTLEDFSLYYRIDSIIVSNETSLPIKNYGNATLVTSECTL